MIDTVQDNLHHAGFVKEAGLGDIAQQAAEGDVGQLKTDEFIQNYRNVYCQLKSAK